MIRRLFAGGAILVVTAAAVALALTLPVESGLHEYDRTSALLVVDLVAAGAIATACMWSALIGRAFAPALMCGCSGACLLADTLTGRSVVPTAAESFGVASGPLLLALLAVAPQATGLPVTWVIRRMQTLLVVLASGAAFAAVFLHEPFLDLRCVRACLPSHVLIARAEWLVAGLRYAAILAALACGGALVRGAIAQAPRLVPTMTAASVTIAAARVAVLARVGDDPHTTVARWLHVLVAVLAVGGLALAMAYELGRVPATRARLRRLLRDLRVLDDMGMERTLRTISSDPDLHLVYAHPRLPGVWIDRRGNAVRDVANAESRTEIRRAGETMGVLLHRRGTIGPRLVSAAIGPAIALAFENERVAAGTVYDVEALRQTSAALVEIGDSERRRIERNLHDGAQQRLVAAGMSLRLAAVRDPALEVTPLLAELSTIIERVRTVAHGIHPAILASAGLGAAIQELADNDDEPRVHLDLGKELGRLPDAVEITIYALVRSAISHAGNRDLEVTISARADTVITEAFPVKSDGAAARDFEALKDRARALAGELILIRDDGATVCRWRLTVPRRHPPPQAGTPDAKSAARTFVS